MKVTITISSTRDMVILNDREAPGGLRFLPGSYFFCRSRLRCSGVGCRRISNFLAGVFTRPHCQSNNLLVNNLNSSLLAKQLSVAERIDKSAYCRPSVTRSAAIIRLRLLEQRSPESSSALSDAQDLQASIKKSLACAPSNPFFWTVLYWLSSQTSSRVPPDYLRLSYKLGPNEGWIALRRNRLAFTLFEKLPKDLQKSAIAEFVRLLNNDFEPNGGLYAAVLDILVGPAWQVRDQITPYLMNLPRRNRESLVRDLSAKGFDLALPGVKQPEQTR